VVLAFRGVWIDDKLPEERVGDEDVAMEFDEGKCMDCDDERRKNGMDEGVRRFDWLRRTEAVGLNGPC
jgi:hypothetical protein